MTKSGFSIAVIYCFLLAGCQSYKLKENKSIEFTKPNIVIIYTDDQNYEHIGSYGGNVYTPHIDNLAKEGIKFSQAYATTAICTPSRYGLMTGRFPSRSKSEGFTSQFPEGVQTEVGFNTHIGPDEENLASIMKKSGYKTGAVGKWDFGTPKNNENGEPFFIPLPQSKNWINAWIEDGKQANPRSPGITKILETNHNKLKQYTKKLGFDYADALYNINPEMWQNHALNIHNMEWVTEAAINFLDLYKDEPFFLYMAPTLHHIPHPQESLIQGDPRMTIAGYLAKAPDVMPSREGIIPRVIKAGYPPETAYCTWLDDAIGAVVQKLKDLDVYDNTMIILMSDHQTLAKTSLYEGGVKTPLIISYPKILDKNKTNEQLVQNIDITPTVLDVCQIETSNKRNIDGKSLLPLLTNEVQSIHDALFFEYGWTRAMRTKRWKYIALRYSKSTDKLRSERGVLYHARSLVPMQHEVLLSHPNYWDANQLYDLSIDAGETTNLAGDIEYKETLTMMKTKLGEWLKTFSNHPFGEFTE